MTLYTKCIHEPPVLEDGIRICVMSRITKNDGKTVDPEIQPFNEWLVELSPSQRDVGAYYRGETNLGELFAHYKKYLARPNIVPHVRTLAQRACNEDLTILCVEKNAANCHRSVLAEECRKYEPQLKVVHRIISPQQP